MTNGEDRVRLELANMSLDLDLFAFSLRHCVDECDSALAAMVS